MNKWDIPAWLETKIIERDRNCVYCGIVFTEEPETRGKKPSWEHIINDARIVSRENIARCCVSCNASKGTKSLATWLDSKYCSRRGICASTIARVARIALAAETGGSPRGLCPTVSDTARKTPRA